MPQQQQVAEEVEERGVEVGPRGLCAASIASLT